MKESIKTNPELSTFTAVFEKKVDFGKVVEVTVVMEGTDKSAPVQVTSIIKKDTQEVIPVSIKKMTSPLPAKKEEIVIESVKLTITKAMISEAKVSVPCMQESLTAISSSNAALAQL